MPITLSPKGVLHMDEAGLAGLPARTAEGLRDAARQSSAHVLLHLATRELDAPLPPAGAFWRQIGRSYLTRLCQTPDLSRSFSIDSPEESELEQWVEAAPPMTGGEYLRPQVLRERWSELDALAQKEIHAHPQGAAGWLKMHSPVWHLVGRVTLHLAENKKDAGHPFAFLATYTHRISDQAKPQYLPLGRALQEFAGTKNRSALLSLLAPLQRAAAASGLVKELVDSQRIFQPQAWPAREAHRFLRDLEIFEAAGLLVRLPEWGRRLVRPTVRVTIGAGRPTGLGLAALLDFEAGLALDGEPLSEAEWRQISQTDDGLVRLRGRWIEVERDKVQKVLDYWKKIEALRRDQGLTFAEGLRLLTGTLPPEGSPALTEDESRCWSQVRPGAWLEQALEQLRHPDPGKAPDPPGLQATLRPYQKAGVHWLRFLSGLGLGACLADDMGLGKTVQVLGALLHWRAGHAEAPPALLVLPASLLGNWLAEAKRFAPSLRVRTVHPSEAEPQVLAAAAKHPRPFLQGQDLVLTTYGMLLKHEWLLQVDWSIAILDEAQAIKNPGARQTRAVKQIKAARRMALTGTPVENSLGDLWSLFDFLNPGLLGQAAEFGRYAKKISKGTANGADASAFAPLRQLVRPYILRRLKSDKCVIADLPDKTEMRAECGLTQRQAVLYQQSLKELEEKIQDAESTQRRAVILAFLMRLKQICNHPAQWLGQGDYTAKESGKFQRLEELTAEIASRQEKALVFTQFREMTGPLQHFLTSVFHRPGLVLDGSTGVRERKGLVEQFQREDGPPFFILSLKAGGTGLTLTEAQHVIHFDRWWNPAVENQATDRAYRIGQKKNVLVHKFVCRGTVEERIDQLIEKKRNLADEILAHGPETALTEMNNEDLMRFVSLDIRAAVQESV